ncbi:hypothetical protein IB286_05855 [Spongiibacter sp. KMU-158]|uniref:Uncharacterized protein n=1 Tax=Spongiibacter pelagi TaxID=2760804 RepID=A0A927GWL1_9GAMM|nr:hypothetical protein [Spongiibacter pelagi]MBD2858529.1 hypothetical protein [Spongiibacter pelagi]
MLSYLELVELANGDIVLQDSDGDEAPLVTIRFSDEAKEHMQGSGMELARIMIQAGLEAMNGVVQAEVLEEDEDDFEQDRTVH